MSTRQGWWWCLLAALCGFSLVASAQDAGPVTGLGQLIATDPQDGAFVRLEIERYHVNVVLQPPVALVQIDQSFFNPTNETQAGTFVFNLPEGASVSRFAMYVTPQSLVEGELIERQKAAEIYGSNVSSRRDPAILEQLGNNLFRIRVFPIVARDSKRILLDFTVPMPASAGRYQFALPLLNDRKPIGDFAISGRIDAPYDPKSLQMPAFPKVKFEPQADGSVTFRHQQEDARTPPIWEINYTAPVDTAVTARLFTTTKKKQTLDDEEQYFVVTVPAERHPHQATKAAPCDVLVLIDTSASIGNLPVAEKVARGIASHMRPDDRLQIGCVDSLFRPLTEDWSAPQSKSVDAALGAIGQQLNLGASFFDETFGQALRVWGEDLGPTATSQPPQRPRVLVYVGDGLAGQIPTSASGMAKMLAEKGIVLHVVRTDLHADARWMEDCAEKTGGRVFDLFQGLRVQREIIELAKSGWQPGVRITELKVPGAPTAQVLADAVWPVGKDLLIYGRRDLIFDGNRVGMPRELTVTFKENGQLRTLQPRVLDKADDSVFTGRLWAQQRLSKFVHRLGAEPGDTALHADILAISQEWSLMSPLTAFLVLEKEADYERWNIERQARRRYWEPQGAVARAVTPLQEFGPRLTEALAAAEVERAQQTIAEKMDPEAAKESLQMVRAALASGDFRLAQATLQVAQSELQTFARDDFEQLKIEVNRGFAWQPSWAKLGDRQSLFDRRVNSVLWKPQPLLVVTQAPVEGTDFARHNPHYKSLLQRVTFPEDEMTLKEFTTYIKEFVKVPLKFDDATLNEAGITGDIPISTRDLNGLTARSALRAALRALNLEIIDDGRFVLMTTDAVCAKRLSTRVYPVSDLEDPARLPRLNQLAHPYLDQEESSRREIEAKLRIPTTVKFKDYPLELVVDRLRRVAGIPLTLDRSTLEAAGIRGDKEINVEFEEMPTGEVIRSILSDLDCQLVIRDEQAVITTRVEANNRMVTRSYSTVGLVDEELRPVNPWMFQGGSVLWPMSGFSGSGIGGFGGGGTPGSGKNTLEIAVIAPPRRNDDESEEAEDKLLRRDSMALAIQQEQQQARVSFLLRNMELKDLVTSVTSGAWLEHNDGSLESNESARALVVRQTDEVHREIEELFRELRLQRRNRPGTSLANINLSTMPHSEWNPSSLMSLLTAATSGGWESEGSGTGTIHPHRPSQSLLIQQTQRTHEEIESVLTQLRRAKYAMAMTGAHADPLDPMLPLPQLGQSTFTDWSLSSPEGTPMVGERTKTRRQRSLEVLTAVRREQSLEASQSIKLAGGVLPTNSGAIWQHSRRSQPSTCFSLARRGSRWQYQSDSRVIRIDGRRVASAIPGLTLVEIDHWGDAARAALDAQLPWLPHRSNAELADLFDVTLEREDEQSSTLRLAARSVDRTYILATYQKSDGQLREWTAIVNQHPRYVLNFNGPQVTCRCLTPAGPASKPARQDQGDKPQPAVAEEAWTLFKVETAAEIPEVDADWKGYVMSRPAQSNASPLHSFQKLVSANQFDQAQVLIAKELKSQPDQPLWHMLRATLDEISREDESDPRPRRIESLKTVLRSEAHDLKSYLHLHRFPSLREAGLLEVFQSVPIERLAVEQASVAADLALAEGQHQLGLKYLDRVDALQAPAKSDGGSLHELNLVSLLRRVELLALEDPATALKLAATCPREPTFSSWHRRLAQIFGSAEQPQLALEYYDLALRDLTLDLFERGQIHLAKAEFQTGVERARSLITAIVTNSFGETEESARANLETITAADLNAAGVDQLLDETQHPGARWHLLWLGARVSQDDVEARTSYLVRMSQAFDGRYPSEWMESQLLELKRHDLLVSFYERCLRRSLPIRWPRFADSLQAVGRTTDAVRVRSQVREAHGRQVPGVLGEEGVSRTVRKF